ncbi:zinc metalloprotease [Spiroplasma sabaudiense Ar-1343]|uniref:Zinc metalloprotease n=1 Tax=Spiroplasma sabaudiense Ar-1343 TaxID=1276257 RepID=W6A8R6_9MOLU|nr:SprT family zinc-dependent metalloprotease [Spiroplasma sabaudiense]AHI53553.1 zinc metalloprotease [Spiroplasma sabaudiense Ar-1343]
MTWIKKKLQYQGNLVEYNLRIADQKNIILKVKEGNIFVSAPHRAADWEINNLIYKNLKKIQAVQSTFTTIQKISFKNDDSFVKIFDKKIKLHITEENIHTTAKPEGIFMKNYQNHENQTQKLYAFLGKYYYNWFEKRLSHWAEIMNLTYKNLSMQNMKTRWGVCYPEREKIVLNTKLIHFLPDVIDYVIVHELSHLVHKNHSKDFWWNVEKFLPNYKDKALVLKQSGI